LLAGGAWPADIRLLGMVTHAEHAHIGVAVASTGSTIYEGDRVSTETAGSVRIGIRAVTLQLDAQSTLVVQRLAAPEDAVLAEVVSGTLIFAAAPTGKIVVAADDASIRPATNVPTVAQVRVLNRRELRVHAQRGALEFSYRGESATIAEGSEYRVLLDPSEREAAIALAVASESEEGKKRLTKHRRFWQHHKFLLLEVGVAAGVGIPLLIHELHEFESPDRPGPP
jgi:hypothetical protein